MGGELDLRRSLIQAGREVLAERGVDALTLREVARRVKVSQAAPYHHFADKADLVSAIAQQGFEDFAGALRAGAETVGGSALQRLRWRRARCRVRSTMWRWRP